MPTSQPAFSARASKHFAIRTISIHSSPIMRMQYDILRSPAFIRGLLVAAMLPLSIASASATSFNITTNSTAAQTLGSASGQTGAVAAGKSLTVSGSTVAVTVSGNNATLTNLGTISQTGNGRVIRDNTGVTGLVINNGSISNSSALMQAADADVIQMNKAVASVTLNNYGSMISTNASAGGSQAVDFSAITSGANIVNNFAGGLMLATEADAVRPGVNGVVFNAGTIKSMTSSGSSSDGIDGQNNSGIQITNAATGLVEGGRHGITGGQVDSATTYTMNVTNNAGGIIRGDNGSGINIDGFNSLQSATIVNNGMIIGQGITGDGDGVDVDGLVNITNTGIIRSVNAFSLPSDGLAFSEGITVGGGTIINSGTIEGLVSAGNTNAVGRGISLSGNDITTGPLAGTREAIYGNATVTNQAGGLIRGQTDSAIVAEGAASGFTVVINNNAGGTLLGGGATTAAVRGGADNTVINNAGIINGASSGKAIELGSAHNTVIISGGNASVIGSINGGSGGTNTMTIDPGTGNSFSYAGAISNFNSVEFKSGNVTLSGQNTYGGTTLISGGTLTLDGVNRISAQSALVLDGGMLDITNGGSSNAETFASLSLDDNSAIDLGLSSLTFNGLGTVIAGKTLTISDFVFTSDYAFRLLGDYSTDANFLELISFTKFDDIAATFRFDGTYTDVTAVPEPEAYAMLLTGLVLLGAMTRRRKQTKVRSRRIYQ
jgi:autotransporter-associated beta strand protein